MKYVFLLCLNFSLFTSVISQNVGIGISNPSEKLDINGNLNLGGDLKINNVTGLAGQILKRSSTNSLIWGDPLETYANNIVLVDTGYTIFTIPNGITKILIEIWGGGGAGSSYVNSIGGNRGGLGGGGGGYARATLKVIGGQSINCLVGKGGSVYLDTITSQSAFYVGSQGESSKVTINGKDIIAYGGGGSGTRHIGSHGFFWPGYGGGFQLNSMQNNEILNCYGINGEDGSCPTIYGSTTSMYTFKAGYGGNSGNSLNTGGSGYCEMNGSTAFPINVIRCLKAKQPGGGGGGEGYIPVSYSFLNDMNGASGMIIIWW